MLSFIQLNYKVPGKVWNTKTDSLQEYEIGLLSVMTLLGFITVMLLLIILPSLNGPTLKLLFNMNCYLGFTAVSLIVLNPTEFLINKIINTGHSVVFHYILTAVPMGLSILIGLYGIILSLLCIGVKKEACYSLCYPLISLPVISITVFSVPILIESFINPTEVISFIGLIVICFAGASTAYTTNNWLIRNGTCICTSVPKKNRNSRCDYESLDAIAEAIVLFSFLLATSGCLAFYMLLLRNRLESPTSQLIQTLLAFIPPILAGFGSYFLSKMLAAGSKDKSEATDESESDNSTNTPTNQTTESDSATEDQQSDTNSSNNQTDPPQSDSPTGDQQHDGGEQQLQSVASDTQRRESPQESEEIQVTVEVNPTNNSDVIQESIV